MNVRVWIVGTLAGAWALTVGCSSSIDIVGQAGQGGEGSSFAEPAEGGAAEVDASLVAYCPSYACPSPFTTCAMSQFPCDVNVMSDPQNCGACGNVCPVYDNSIFDCVAGRCVMHCTEKAADCNGLLEDDCEVTFGTNDNCSACGDVCSDPAKPCIYDDRKHESKCGCDAGLSVCGASCVDLQTTDQACGSCEQACPSTGDTEPPKQMYYGCSNGECGHLKCDAQWADCDHDLGNGCETSTLSVDNCGACGKACDPGQSCELNADNQPECLCPAGKTRCGRSCVDLRTDLSNCGGCGIACSALATTTTGIGTCSYGVCNFACRQGWGDCNGDLSDGCEVNLDSDQRNCGTCGTTCDVVSGQPCILGQCAVEPCPATPGEVTR